MFKIAIVDDNETWCFVLANFLQQEGLAVETFSDARKFLAVAAQFDLALVDFSMPAPIYRPEIDGAILIEQIKTQIENPPTLLLISSFFTPDMVQHSQAICEHADACLSKSLGLEGLLAELQKWIPQKEQIDLQRRDFSLMVDDSKTNL
ncbi:response regulator [Leptolyngbya sp. NIES-2104]|uniref:response regulator n=1 Tax=Leptolyngbya sp. NIES-2104 TaxID=1552121 RepID=UPI0006ECB97C|nr:response regulator [Leptolyngbya sp. NIES-2104]GAP98768.1 response regulator [Leptolyngbya sp. NIES-2104]